MTEQDYEELVEVMRYAGNSGKISDENLRLNALNAFRNALKAGVWEDGSPLEERERQLLSEYLHMVSQKNIVRTFPLSLKELNKANRHNIKRIMAWTPLEWGGAAAGELGEACNLLKKLRRGDEIPMELIAEELADALISIDLIACRLDIDLEAAIIEKFNKVCRQHGVP